MVTSIILTWNEASIWNLQQRHAHSNKKYTLNNIPAAYANVAEHGNDHCVYYGDFGVDDGHYMETKSPYHDTIVNLMKNRIKYGLVDKLTFSQLVANWW